MMQKRLIRNTSLGVANKVWRIPWLFVLLLIALACVGYLALWTAGGGDANAYANKHAVRFVFCLGLMGAIALVDIRAIQKAAWPLYAVALLLLVLVLLVGNVGKGAQRWLDLGVVQLQPSELMKIFLCVALASWFHRAAWERVGNPIFLIPPLLAILVPVVLILRQPNLGTAAITAMVGCAVLFAAGLRWWKIGLAIAAVVVVAPIAYEHLHDYQRARITTFLNPENDPLGAGYNIIQSRIALGSGGMWGKGFLQGTQGHLNFLPEKQTDFIFTMWAEEFGLVGALGLLGLMGLIVLAGMVIALRCRHQFGRLVALGISFNFSMYVFVNVAMVMGVIPVGGVPLPLVSHGGSAMLTTMVGFGLLLSVHVHRDAEFADRSDDG